MNAVTRAHEHSDAMCVHGTLTAIEAVDLQRHPHDASYKLDASPAAYWLPSHSGSRLLQHPYDKLPAPLTSLRCALFVIEQYYLGSRN